MHKGHVSRPIAIQFHLAEYGNDLLMEGVGLDAGSYEAIRASLPKDVQVRCFGWRNLAMLPYGKGETYIPHPLDTMDSSSL